jgi:hypothetical protein
MHERRIKVILRKMSNIFAEKMLSLREKHRDKILLLHRIIIVHDGARLVAIDVLSKYAVVLPLKQKRAFL